MGGFFGNLKDKVGNALLSMGAKEQAYEDYYDDEDYDDDYEEEQEPASKVESIRASRRPSQEINRRNSREAYNRKVVDFSSRANVDNANIETIIKHPNEVADAMEICAHVKSGRMVIVDLSGVDAGVAQRIADYLGGMAYGVDGETSRVNDYIFTVSPRNHRVSSDYDLYKTERGSYTEELKAVGR
ncbi:MAG: cell division protein SepF [Defluviitaleaceae bacterium]|nr:cell division protein SepF [Defluviitaleaceae bacterium]